MKYFLFSLLLLAYGCSSSSRWAFEEPPSTMVVSQRKIIEKKKPILFVLHDNEGDWQFLADDENGGMDQVVELPLNDIIQMDNSIATISELAKGWKAVRANNSSPWNISLYGQKVSVESQLSTQRVRSDTNYSFQIYIYTNDSGYVHGIRSSMSTGFTTTYKDISDYDLKNLFYGYDTTIIGFNKKYIVPFKIGRTKVYLRNPDKLDSVADSIDIEVLKGKKNLYLQKRSP